MTVSEELTCFTGISIWASKQGHIKIVRVHLPLHEGHLSTSSDVGRRSRQQKDNLTPQKGREASVGLAEVRKIHA
jgi:hypothetical protein